MKINKIYPKDIIAVICLIAGFILLGLGRDSYVTAMVTLILGYYFSKRVYEERTANT